MQQQWSRRTKPIIAATVAVAARTYGNSVVCQFVRTQVTTNQTPNSVSSHRLVPQPELRIAGWG